VDPFGGMTIVVLLICPPNYTNPDTQCRRYEMQYSSDMSDPTSPGLSVTACNLGGGQIAIRDWMERHPRAVYQAKRYKCMTGRQAVADRNL